MSAKGDSSSNIDDENIFPNQDDENQDTEKRSEGNILIIGRENAKNNGDTPQKPSEIANITSEGNNKDSGDATAVILNKESTRSEKMESEDYFFSDAGKGSGDYSDNLNASEETQKKVDDAIIFPKAIIEKDDTNDSFLEKDDGDDIEDDDLTLRWDDDDGSQPLGDDNENSGTKNDENLSEEQLLKESSDAVMKEATAKRSEHNLDDDSIIDTEISVCNLDVEKETKTIDTTDKSLNSPKQDMSTDKIDAKTTDTILEDKLLEESDAETDFVPEKDINDLESELLEELDIESSETQNDRGENIHKDAHKIDKRSEINQENKRTTQKESTNETPATEFQIKSFTDAILNPDSEELDDNILEEAEAIIDSSGIIPDDSHSKDLEYSEEELLEDKILDEIKSAEEMLEADIAMDVDDDAEGELLKDDESQDGIAPMSIDNNLSTEDPVKGKIDQPMTNNETKESIRKDKDEDSIKNEGKDKTGDSKVTTEFKGPIQDSTEPEPIERIDTGEPSNEIIDKQTKDDDEDQLMDISLVEESNSEPIEVKAPTLVQTTLKDNTEKSLPGEENNSPLRAPNDEQITETENLDKTMENADISASNSSTYFEHSPVHIKTKHGLHKPDVMLEIPTQELIDIDTDLSLELDQSEVLDESNADDDIEEEKTVTSEKLVEKSTNEQTNIIEMDLKDKTVTDMVADTIVDKEGIMTENVIKQKSVDIETSIPQKQPMTDTPISLKHKEATQDSVLEENIQPHDGLGSDTTNTTSRVSEIAVSQENKVGEAIVSNTTINNEVIMAEDSINPETLVKENVVNAAATSDTTINKEAIVNKKAVSQDNSIEEGIPAKDGTVTKNTVSPETVADRRITPEVSIAADEVTPIIDKTVNKEMTIEENIAPQEFNDPVTGNNVSVTMTDKPVGEVEGMHVPETIEESMERMFADDEPVKEFVKATPTTIMDVNPSTSQTLTPDTSDEVPEVSDSLGLLAESSGRMMEDDEEHDDDDDADDDDDFDQDESSNQISAEQSEDSNPPILDTDTAQHGTKDFDTPDPKNEEFQFTMESGAADKDKMDVQFGDVELPAESINDEETKTAVDALLRDGAPPDEQAPVDDTDQMDVDTVKLSDTSDNEGEVQTAGDQTEGETGKDLEAKQTSQSPLKQSPSKVKKLEITAQEPSSVVNYVDLEESSEDEIQEVEKPREKPTEIEKPSSPDAESVTDVNIPTGIEIMCTSATGSTSEIVTKEKEVIISGVPKPPPHKTARLNTSEVSIKTTTSNTEPLVIPETKINDSTQTAGQTQPKDCLEKDGLEIFSLDSDDEKCSAKDTTPVEYYEDGKKKRAMVCMPCAEVVADRTKNLIQGIKHLTPLLDLDMGNLMQDLVEISDSESEEEDTSPADPKDSIGEEGAKFVEENLVKYLNETWLKYDMDTRLKETQIMLDDEMEKLEHDSKEIDAMLNDCQVATDKLRCDLYATFECRRHELPPIVLYDTPDVKLVGFESEPNSDSIMSSTETAESRQAKRRLSSSSDVPAKRPAIPLGYTPLETPSKDPKAAIPLPDAKIEDDKDISVVKLSAESAPAELPPPGEISRPPLRVSMSVYAMKNAFGPWLKGKVLDIQPKNPAAGSPFSVCRIKFDHKRQANGKVLPARCIAYSEPADVRMTIGTRLIALFKDTNKRESYYSGVVAEIPNPVNNYRYLVFFDDGYAQYVQHQHTRIVCESSALVWEEVHPFSREFVREYLMAYPERPMVRLHEGQHLKTEWNGKWWSSRVTKVDASLAQVLFVGDGRREWIYRGSTRLAPLYLELKAAERHRPRPMPRSKAQPRLNMPYVEYTRSDEQESSKQAEAHAQQQQQQNEEIRRQRAVAKKSTSVVQPPPVPQTPGPVDTVTSRVVYYTPKNAVKPYKMVPHKCGPKCKRSDVLTLKELRTYNPLAKPLLSGWERQIVRFKGHKEVMYRAPCGRRLRNVRELHRYLRAVACDLPVDLFDFHPATHCLAEFVLNKCRVGKKDLSHGKENVPVPCVNYYDDSLPEFCSYNTERTPTAGVPLNLDPEFLCGCDCTDDCQDKSKCACWKMTLEGARTIGLEGPSVGYVYKRLPEPLPSGIYECNSRCKCKNTCLNRVAQHPLQLKLQVFKTLNRGWGIRALNDVPKGSFLCVYAGNLLTDATANLDGLNEGDEYLAELDYIEVVEQMKEGYEEDIPEADKKLDKKESGKDEASDENEPSSSEEEDNASKTDKEDDDFRPGYIGLGLTEFNKRLRKRERNKKDKEKSETDEKEKEKDKDKEKESKDKEKDAKETNADEDCITISDDEEVREPSRFNVQAGMGASEFISKYKSVRTLFGKDEACYIMDAKVQGNIGRYLNHSCCPNVFVQNVFVDTHDPRFPWVAFFALSHIKAGTELTWNYNYDVGSVPGKVLYCHCGAPNCRGRLL